MARSLRAVNPREEVALLRMELSRVRDQLRGVEAEREQFRHREWCCWLALGRHPSCGWGLPYAIEFALEDARRRGPKPRHRNGDT